MEEEAVEEALTSVKDQGIDLPVRAADIDTTTWRQPPPSCVSPSLIVVREKCRR